MTYSKPHGAAYYEQIYGFVGAKKWKLVMLAIAYFVFTSSGVIFGTLLGSVLIQTVGWDLGTTFVAICATAVGEKLYNRGKKYPERYSFAPWKYLPATQLMGATLIPAMVFVFVLPETVHKLIDPMPIQYKPAIITAVVAAIVNSIGGWYMHHGETQRHDSQHAAEAFLKIGVAYYGVSAVVLYFAQRYDMPVLDPIVSLLGVLVILWWAMSIILRAFDALVDALHIRPSLVKFWEKQEHPIYIAVKEEVARRYPGSRIVRSPSITQGGPTYYRAEVEISGAWDDDGSSVRYPKFTTAGGDDVLLTVHRIVTAAK